MIMHCSIQTDGILDLATNLVMISKGEKNFWSLKSIKKTVGETMELLEKARDKVASIFSLKQGNEPKRKSQMRQQNRHKSEKRIRLRYKEMRRQFNERFSRSRKTLNLPWKNTSLSTTKQGNAPKRKSQMRQQNRHKSEKRIRLRYKEMRRQFNERFSRSRKTLNLPWIKTSLSTTTTLSLMQLLH